MELPLIIRVFSEYNVRSSFELLAAFAVIPLYEKNIREDTACEG